MSAFDMARDLRLPGVVVTGVHIDPTQISARLKNSVIRMLTTGETVGGWSSKARQLAMKLAETYGIVLTSSYGHQLVCTQMRSIDDDVQKQLLEVNEASLGLRMMELSGDPHSSYARTHAVNYHDENRATICGLRDRHWLVFANEGFVQQAAQIILYARTEEQRNKARDVCSKLMGNEPIPIPLSV